MLWAGLSAQNYYTVKFPDDKTVYGCGGTADTIWPIITQYGGCSYNVGVSIKDQVFYTNGNQTCLKILRKWTLLYWCDYNPNWPSPYYIFNPTNTDVGPTVIGNSYNHGYLTYTQVIKIVDNVPPVFLNCPNTTVTFCDYTGNDPTQYNNGWQDRCEGPVDLTVKVTDACSKSNINLSYRLYLDLDNNGTMETYISSSDAGAWPIEKTIVADTVVGKVKFPPGVGLPYAKHKIEWIANDNCAGESLCKYEFIVKDCKAPTIVCINGLSINIMQTGMITLWDTDFVQYYNDNCTPTNQIKIGIRKAGTGTGFPQDNHSVTFNCTELGTQPVEIWAVDAYGNADYCLTYVIVQDNMGSCPAQTAPKGNVLTDQSSPVAGVTLELHSNVAGLPLVATKITDTLGHYQFAGNFPVGSYLLKPVLNTHPEEGVNTMDVLLTAAHVGNILTLNTPNKLIAADANHDNQINADDLLDVVKVITGQSTAFTNNSAWRFIPQPYTFPDPLHPLATAFPESAVLNSGTSTYNFTGIKTADVDGTVNTNLLGSPDDRSPEELVDFQAPDIAFTAGQIISVDILTPDMFTLAAFQFTLGYDLSALQLVGITPGLVPGAQIGNLPAQGKVAASWYSAVVLAGASWGNQRFVAFTLSFKSLQNGLLKEKLSMNSTVAASQAYDNQLKTLDAVLEFHAVQNTQSLAVLHPVQPNPAHEQIIASYTMPDAGRLTLRLVDASSGQTVLENRDIQAPKGEGQTVLDISALNVSGLLILQMESEFGTGVQKVIVHK